MIVSEKKTIKIYQIIFCFYFKKYLNLIKKRIISREKMSNSGNFIYDYAHSFIVEDFEFDTINCSCICFIFLHVILWIDLQ